MKPSFAGKPYSHEQAYSKAPISRAMTDLHEAFLRLRQSAAPMLALVLALPIAAAAQETGPRARIIAPINENNLTALRGNIHPLARPRYDQGAVADSQPLRRILLLLKRSPEQEATLLSLIDQQQSKSSPSFHQWLTPRQFGQQFGPADADVQAVTNWLQSHGFQIARVSAAKTLIEFSGTAGQVSNAFHTQIHRYSVNGELHYANATDPQIPAALAPVVAGPVSLHNFPRKPQSRKLGVFRKNLVTGQVVPLLTFNGCSATPNSATGSTCNALGPGDFATIYNVFSLWNAGIDGTGQTIAVVGDSQICTASSPDFAADCGGNDDVAAFRSIFGLPANLPTVIVDGPDPGFNTDEIEGDLDVQWSGAVAKNAAIDFVTAETTESSAGVDLAAEHIVDNNLAPVLSESFAACEGSLGTTGNQFYSNLWEQAAAQGITVIVSAGDDGSAGCDDQNTQNSASAFGPGVNGIASTLFNVATGGTDFDITATNYQNTYWGGDATVGGIMHISALKYIPETTWNDSCAQNFTAANSCSPPPSVASLNIVSGSGGQSNCTQLDTVTSSCTASYPKPSWQVVASGSGLNASSDTSRDLPDVALFAADGMVSNSFYAVCDFNINGVPCSATPGSVEVVGVGGTSSAAPTFAGIMALVNQKMANLNAANNNNLLPVRQGNANYALYNLYSKQSAQTSLDCSSSASNGPASGCTFNDITKGNNSVPCVGQSFGCSDTADTGSYGVLEIVDAFGNPSGILAFNAGTGFDLASGLGSLNAANLVNNWDSAVGAFKPTTTTLCLWTSSAASCPTPAPTSISITHGQQVNVQITVTPAPSASSTIAEDASLIGCLSSTVPCTAASSNTVAADRFAVNASNQTVSNSDVYTLSNGSINTSTKFLVGGSYSVIAHYAGDGTYGGSDSPSPIRVTVNPEPSTATVSVSTLNLLTQNTSTQSTVPYGDFDLIRVDVKGANSGQESASGAVTLQDNGGSIVDPNGNPATSFNLNSEGNLEDQTAFLAVGQHSFTAKFNGDPSYSAMTSFTAPVILSVTKAPTVTSVTASSTFVAPNTSFTLTAFVDTQTSTNPSGGSSGLAPTGTVMFFAGTTNLGTVNLSATTDSNQFVAGQATLTVTNGLPSTPTTAAITATYSGDPNYTTSTSSGVSVTVSNAPTFTLSSSNGGNITVNSPGLSGSATITATGSAGFSGAITLAVGGLSPNNLDDPPSCSFGSTNMIMLNSSASPPVMSGSGTLTCTTTAVRKAVIIPSSRPRMPNGFLAGEVAAALACFLLLAAAGRRGRGVVLLAVALFAAAFLGTSCNGGNYGLVGPRGTGSPGTTVGTYTITVTAKSSTGIPQQTTTITLTVN